MIAVRALGVDHVAANLRQLGRDAEATAKRVADQGGMVVWRLLQRRINVKGPVDPFWGQQGAPGAALGHRSGQTAQHILPPISFRTPGGSWSASVGSPDRHMVTHEYGGTITGSPMLKIPTAEALRRNSGTSAFAGTPARQIPGAFIWRGKHAEGASDRAWIAVREGDRLVLLYLLKRRVTLRPRGIFKATREEADPLVARIGAASMEVATRKANS